MKTNINELIKKAEDAKAIDFFVDVLNFLQEVKPVLVLMNSTIVDGTTRIPNASKKLSSVTEATEVATTEIMNILDQVFAKVNNLRKGTADKDELAVIENDLNNIMMALQVQDITSQQIAAVNHTLQLLHNKLNQLLKHFDEDYIKQLLDVDLKDYYSVENVSKLHRDIAFDPDAINAITSNVNRQDAIDDLIQKANSGENIDLESFGLNNKNSEDDTDIDIDALFSGQTSGEVASNDDIDALFANNSDSEEISSDDIDALFNAK